MQASDFVPGHEKMVQEIGQGAGPVELAHCMQGCTYNGCARIAIPHETLGV